MKVVSFLLSLGDRKTWPYARLMDSGVLTELSTLATGNSSLTLAYLGRPEDEWEQLSAAISLKNAMTNEDWCKRAARAIKTAIMDVGEGAAAAAFSKKVVEQMRIESKAKAAAEKAKMARDLKDAESSGKEEDDIGGTSKRKQADKGKDNMETSETQDDDEQLL